MKSNYIPIKKKKPIKIVIETDKTLDKLDLNAFNEQFEQAIRERAMAAQYSTEQVGRALREAIDAIGQIPREVIDNIEDELLVGRQAQLERLVDIRNAGL